MFSDKDRYLPTEDANTGKVGFNIFLPSCVDARYIKVHIGRIHQLCRLGGIKHLTVTGNIDGETTRSMPTIVGCDSQGNAYAGKKAEKTNAPSFTVSSNKDTGTDDLPHAAVWVNGKIDLNINEITEQIRQETNWQRGVYTAEAWAYHLDRFVREGIADIGTKHLVWGLSKNHQDWAIRCYSLLAGIEIASPDTLSLGGFIIFVLQASTAINIASYTIGALSRKEVKKLDEGFRLSFFYGPQPDRALLLNILAQRRGLIKSFEPQNSKLLH